jgi:hypothetical protein
MRLEVIFDAHLTHLLRQSREHLLSNIKREVVLIFDPLRTRTGLRVLSRRLVQFVLQGVNKLYLFLLKLLVLVRVIVQAVFMLSLLFI